MSRTTPVLATSQGGWLSLQDAAEVYAISVATLRRRIASGDLPALRCGRRIIRVRTHDLEALFRPIPSAKSVSARRAAR